MESYKTQILDFETKTSVKAKEIETLKYELEQTNKRLNITIQERVQDAEALELYQERVKELELSDAGNRMRSHRDAVTSSIHDSKSSSGENDPDLGEEFNLGGELDDAISGRTMTDLKLQIRRLKLDLKEAKSNSTDASRIVFLESRLEDANRVRARYEADYLAAHREKLVLQNQLDAMKNGKSGDGQVKSPLPKSII